MYKIPIIIGVFLASAGVAMGCSFTPDADRMKSIEENYANQKYQNIFLGQVKEVEKASDNTTGPQYLIAVTQSYRGEVMGDLEITSAAHSCGSFYQEGDIMIWFLSDDLGYVDERNPQYRFDSLEDAKSHMIQIVQSNGEVDAPWVQGPTTNPGDGFVGPSTPPPSTPESESSLPWYKRIFEWILGLFK
ncbi:MAG: hypothetical protein ACKKL4_01715 [Patescibacteria group bacterium]